MNHQHHGSFPRPDWAEDSQRAFPSAVQLALCVAAPGDACVLLRGGPPAWHQPCHERRQQARQR